MRTLVLYSFTEYTPRSIFFLEQGVFKSPLVTFSSVRREDERLAKVNLEEEYEEYDRFIFIEEERAVGPFLPLWYKGEKTWVDIFGGLLTDEIKLAGPIIKEAYPRNCLVTDRKGLETAMEKNLLRLEGPSLWKSFTSSIVEAGFSVGSLNEERKEGDPLFHPYETIFCDYVDGHYLHWHSLNRSLGGGLRDEERVLILYTFHEFDSNVQYFLERGYLDDPRVDFLFVVNDKGFQGELPGKTIIRDNVGHDFGAWQEGILHDDNHTKYDYFVFVNSSVRGPFVPPYCDKNWVEVFCGLFSPGVGVVGSTAAVSSAQEKLGTEDFLKLYVQSYAFALNRESLFLLRGGLFSQDFASMSKESLVCSAEENISHFLLSAGYTLQTLQSSYYNRDFLLFPHDYSREDFDPTRYRNHYYGMNLHPFEVLFLKNLRRNPFFSREVEYYTQLYL